MATVSLSGLVELDDATSGSGSATSSAILTAMGATAAAFTAQAGTATDRTSSGYQWRTESDPEARRWATSGDKDFSSPDRLLICNIISSAAPAFFPGLQNVSVGAIRIYIADSSASTYRQWTVGGKDQAHMDVAGYGIASVISCSNDFDIADESGTAITLSTVDEIGYYGTKGAASNVRPNASWIGYTDGLVLVGGDGGDTDGHWNDFYDYTDNTPGADSSNLPVNVIASLAGGRVFNISVPVFIGNGSTATAFTATLVSTINFLQNSDVQADYPPINVLPNLIGLRVNAATGDLVTINNHTLQSPSPWYLKFE